MVTPEKVRVLVLEDSPLHAQMVQQTLNQSSMSVFEIELVDRLTNALACLDARKIDVILTDLSVLDSYGLDTFMRLHKHAPSVPIVILTGTYEDEQMAIKALQMGAQDYLIKGEIDPKLLIRVLRYAVERQRTEEALRMKTQALEDKVQELEQLNKIMLDREERILELKDEIRRLEAQIPRKAPPAR